MHRRMLAAVFAVLIVPGTVAAQTRPGQEEVVLIRGLRLSPFVGYLTGFTRTEEWFYQEGTESAFVQTDVEVAGGGAVGMQFEAPLSRRLGIVGAGGYASRGDTDFGVRQNGDVFRIDGNQALFGRLGLALHLHEPDSELVIRSLGASLFVGGAVMHERPRNRLGTGDALSNGTHFGLNMGVNAEVPFASDRLAVQLGLENNMMWWSKSALRSLAYEYFGRPGSSDANTTVSADVTQTWLIRAGLQFRL